MAKRNMNGYYALRWHILERDNFTCQYCGQKAPNVLLEVDHVLPLADGGADEPENLKTSCIACNRGRSALSIIIKRRQKQGQPIAKPFTPTTLKPRTPMVCEIVAKHPHCKALDVAKIGNITMQHAWIALQRACASGLIERLPDKTYIALLDR